MDFIFSIIKQLATTLSPSEFLTVLVLIAAVIFVIVKVVVKNAKGSKSLFNLFTGADSENDKIVELTTKVNGMATAADLEKAEQRIMTMLENLRKEAKAHDEDLTSQLTTISLMKVEIKNEFDSLIKQLNDLQHSTKMQDIRNEAGFRSISDALQKNQELILSIVSKLEKVDEFVRTSAPEFRGYHKELSKEIGELSKDIAIMDRVLQAQINTSKAGITLR